MGVVEPIISRGATVYGATFLQGERTLATVKLGLERRKRPDQPYRGIVVLNQARVEETLRERLGTLGGVVERSRELAGFYETADGVVATVSNTATGQTEEIHAAYLVGCDGAHSYVRKALGLTFEGSAYPEHFVLGDVEAEGGDLPLDTTLAWLHEDGMLVSFPFPEIGLRRCSRSSTLTRKARFPKPRWSYFGGCSPSAPGTLGCACVTRCGCRTIRSTAAW
jgi:2-polyprenyl-6-methoxyphenol hydroxylase-like FAD-dependent oxidoreductase